MASHQSTDSVSAAPLLSFSDLFVISQDEQHEQHTDTGVESNQAFSELSDSVDMLTLQDDLPMEHTYNNGHCPECFRIVFMITEEKIKVPRCVYTARSVVRDVYMSGDQLENQERMHEVPEVGILDPDEVNFYKHALHQTSDHRNHPEWTDRPFDDLLDSADEELFPGVTITQFSDGQHNNHQAGQQSPEMANTQQELAISQAVENLLQQKAPIFYETVKDFSKQSEIGEESDTGSAAVSDDETTEFAPFEYTGRIKTVEEANAVLDHLATGGGSTKLDIAYDDWMQVKGHDHVMYCRQLFEALISAPVIVPEGFDDHAKQYFSNHQNNSLRKIKTLLEDKDSHTMVEAYIVKAMGAIIEIHEKGVPKRIQAQPTSSLNYRLEDGFTCSERVESVIKAARTNKYVALDIAQGIDMTNLARSPVAYSQRKIDNAKVNAKKALRNKAQVQVREEKPDEKVTTSRVTKKRRVTDRTGESSEDELFQPGPSTRRGNKHKSSGKREDSDDETEFTPRLGRRASKRTKC